MKKCAALIRKVLLTTRIYSITSCKLALNVLNMPRVLQDSASFLHAFNMSRAYRPQGGRGRHTCTFITAHVHTVCTLIISGLPQLFKEEGHYSSGVCTL